MMRLCAIALVAAAVSACADEGGEVLLVLRNQAPGENCLISASESDPFTPAGILDTAAALAGRGYLLTPLVKNISTTATATEAQRTIIAHGANVDLRFADQQKFGDDINGFEQAGLTRFQVPFSGAVSPNGGTASFSFEVIPAQLIAAIQPKLAAFERTVILADVVIFGDMSGGRVESQTFTYPVDVCNGCLVNTIGDCAMVPQSFEPRPGGACNPFQDAVVDCCTSGGGNILVCPAQGTGT